MTERIRIKANEVELTYATQDKTWVKFCVPNKIADKIKHGLTGNSEIVEFEGVE